MIVNALGKACPLPVIEAKKALEQAGAHEVIEVWVDNEIAVQNLTKMAKHKGLEVTDEKVADREYHVKIDAGEKKETDKIEDTTGQGLSQEGADHSEPLCQECSGAGKVVVIASDCMGSGDDVLGKLLMKGFLFALTQQEVLPQTILLYNGGAKWSCEGSAALEDLKSMEEQGVEILTCGTCLNHYGLSEKLAVGSVTNMYEIAEKMLGARLLVRP
ncbi:MAG: sulfurtransferase-like selenium metabolism protein YedF [bacterium]|nr:sulfurtransferase-like selenium metabolism protein YedF [bacterium]